MTDKAIDMYDINKTKEISNKVNRALNKDNIIKKYNRRKEKIEEKNKKKYFIFMMFNFIVIISVYLSFYYMVQEISDGNENIIIEDFLFKIKCIMVALGGVDIIFAAVLLKIRLRIEKYIDRIKKKGQIKEVRKIIKENSKEIFLTIMYLKENNNLSYLNDDFVQMIINIRDEDIAKEKRNKALKDSIDQVSIKEYYLEYDNIVENSVIENS